MHSRITATLVAATAAAAFASLPAGALAHGTKTVPEGNAGTTRAKVELDLELPVPHLPVTVSYRTADGTATAGRDYVPKAGSVTFGPLDTEREVSVSIIGDTLYEGDETFFLETSGAGGGEDEHDRTITIADDDPAPVVSVGDVTVSENAGSARFDLSLSTPSALPATVAYSTADGTAQAGSDYAARSGTVTFAPGELTRSVDVPLVADAAHEDTEGFVLNLSAPVGATLGAAQGHATIVDDDAAATPVAPAAPVIVVRPASTAAPQLIVEPKPMRLAYTGLIGRGTVLMHLSCPAGRACAGDLQLMRSGLAAGHATYALAGGTAGDVAVRLTRDARRRLARRGHVALTAISSSGAPIRFTARV